MIHMQVHEWENMTWHKVLGFLVACYQAEKLDDGQKV
jgi:hypothetical protein